MAEPNTNPTGNGSGEGAGGTTPPVTPPASQTQTPTPQSNTDDPPPAPGLSEDQVAALIEKARADEKKKVFSKLEAVQKEKEDLAARQKVLEEDLKTSQSQLGEVREGKMSELKSVNEELGKLKEMNEKLEKAVEEVASVAADKIAESELKAFRESKIKDAELQLPELVTGETREEIEVSIKDAKTRENKMKDQLREDVRKEIAADLPAPISPDGSQGRGPSDRVTPSNRVATAKLKGEDYTKARAQILEEAKTKVGL